MRSRTNRGRVDFGGEEECCAIGAELTPERGEEIQELEDFDIFAWFSEGVVLCSRNNE